MNQAPRLRFGIMCAGDELPASLAASVRELLAVGGVELALLVVDGEKPAASPFREKAARALRSGHLLWSAYSVFLPQERLTACRPVDMTREFAGVPRVECTVVRKGRFSEYFADEDVARIREFKLDFILRFAFGIVRGEILNAATHGVWSFHHGDESKFRGVPPGFWEMYFGEPVTGAILQRLNDRLDGGVVLQRCFVDTHEISYRTQLDGLLWATTYMPAKVCRDLKNGCASYLHDAPSRTTAPVLRVPNDFATTKFFLRSAGRWGKTQLESVFMAPGWNVGVVAAPMHAFLRPDFRPEIRWLPNGQTDHFLADPFVVSLNGHATLIAEDFDARKDRASLVQLDVDERGALIGAPKTAIDEGVHMSYPCVFAYRGKTYCTPECSEKRGVFLYVFDDARNEWTPAAQLIENFAAVDPTVFEHDGRWWLFCTNNDDFVNAKLHLWHAPDPFGPWEPHASNPVKFDVRSSRPAGRPFTYEGALYRPAQDCSRGYGGAITINRIVRLDARQFEEEPAAVVRPRGDSAYGKGLHTISSLEGSSLTVIDGNRLVLAPGFAWRRITEKVRRITSTAR